MWGKSWAWFEDLRAHSLGNNTSVPANGTPRWPRASSLEKGMIAELVKTGFIVWFAPGGHRVLTEDSKMIGFGRDHERWHWRCTSVACGAM